MYNVVVFFISAMLDFASFQYRDFPTNPQYQQGPVQNQNSFQNQQPQQTFYPQDIPQQSYYQPQHQFQGPQANYPNYSPQQNSYRPQNISPQQSYQPRNSPPRQSYQPQNSPPQQLYQPRSSPPQNSYQPQNSPPYQPYQSNGFPEHGTYHQNPPEQKPFSYYQNPQPQQPQFPTKYQQATPYQPQQQPKSRTLRLPYRSEAPLYPNQPNQQGYYGGYKPPSFATLNPHERHPNDSITRAAVGMHETVPTPQMKYDEDDNPVLSFGHDGFAQGLGDRAAKWGEFPYNVQIRKYGYFACGGALVRSPITGRHVVITATHCLVKSRTTSLEDTSTFEVRMGILGKDDEAQVRKAVALLAHPGYVVIGSKAWPLHNDIGLLIPERDFDECDVVRPIDLPTSAGPTLLDSISVVGWGRGREASNTGTPKTLRSMNLPIWDNDDCDNVFFNESGLHIITEEHFCAGFGEGGRGICNGDSGSSAVSLDKGRPYLAGVVSWGKGCGSRGFPGVFLRVWSYMGWILQTLSDYEKFGKIPHPPQEERIA